MNAYTVTVSIAAFLLVLCGVVCSRLARQGKWVAAPSTWILLSTTMCLSGLMYLASPDRSLTKNIAVTAGVVNTLLILSGVMKGKSLKGLWQSFSNRQRQSIQMSAIVFAFWCVTVGRYPLLSYVLVQLIGLFAYVGTVEKLMSAERVTEPLFLWVSVFLASLCSLYPAFAKHDTYAKVYLARALPSLGFVIVLILRAKIRERKVLMRASAHAASLQTQ